MSENLTPYEQTYGAAQPKQPAAAGQAQPPSPDPQARVQADAPQPPAPQGASAPVAAPPTPSAKRKAWPWVVLGCAVALLLVVGGCASCAVVSTIAALDDRAERLGHDGYGHPYDDGYYDDLFGGYDDDYGYIYDDDELMELYRDSMAGLTFDDIVDLTGIEEGAYDSSSLGEGVYRVGADGIKPGLYYLEGTQDAVGAYLVFDLASHGGEDTYDLDDSIIYVGNYFAELEKGDVIAFMPPTGSNAKMRLATAEPIGATAPYQSGCYRVGIDIPAGTYTITFEPQAAAALVDMDAEPGAYVMDDLEFDRDSIAEEALVIAGGKKTVTVKAGQYLELIGAQAAPQG